MDTEGELCNFHLLDQNRTVIFCEHSIFFFLEETSTFIIKKQIHRKWKKGKQNAHWLLLFVLSYQAERCQQGRSSPPHRREHHTARAASAGRWDMMESTPAHRGCTPGRCHTAELERIGAGQWRWANSTRLCLCIVDIDIRQSSWDLQRM